MNGWFSALACKTQAKGKSCCYREPSFLKLAVNRREANIPEVAARQENFQKSLLSYHERIFQGSPFFLRTSTSRAEPTPW